MPGLTITMSAPSPRSSATSRKASSPLADPSGSCACRPCQARPRAHRFAERAVKGRGIFRRIGHDQGVVRPFSSSAARMAPTRPSIMSEGAMMSAARFGLHQGLNGTRTSMVASFMDIAVPHQPVMAVAGIGIQRHVAHHARSAAPPDLMALHGAAHQIVGVVRLRARPRCSARSVLGKSAITGNAQRRRLLRRRHRQVNGKPFHAGHGGDRAARILRRRSRRAARSGRRATACFPPPGRRVQSCRRRRRMRR